MLQPGEIIQVAEMVVVNKQTNKEQQRLVEVCQRQNNIFQVPGARDDGGDQTFLRLVDGGFAFRFNRKTGAAVSHAFETGISTQGRENLDRRFRS